MSERFESPGAGEPSQRPVDPIAPIAPAAASDLSNRRRRRRQYATCAALFAAATGAVFVAMTPEDDPIPKAAKAGSPVAVHPDYVQRQGYIEKSEAQAREAAARMKRIEEKMNALSESLDAKVGDLSEKLAKQTAALDAMEAGRTHDGKPSGTPASDVRFPAAGGASNSSAFGDPQALDDAYDEASRTGDVSEGQAAVPEPRVSRLAIATMTPPKPADSRAEPSGPARKLAPAPYLQPDKPVAVNRAPGATAATYLPPGAFMKATLLTGLYAVTGGADDPVPVLMKIETDATLPNAWQSGLRDCHATGSATGSLSSERVLIRLDRLACVSEKGEMLDLRVQGYAAGPDGKVGVRGRIVSRSGQAIAAAMTTGLMEGFGRSVSLSSQTVSTSLSTGVQTKDYSRAWAAGLGEGFSNAIGRIADYYLKLANQILPVLEVDSGIQVSLVISQGVMLSAKQ